MLLNVRLKPQDNRPNGRRTTVLTVTVKTDDHFADERYADETDTNYFQSLLFTLISVYNPEEVPGLRSEIRMKTTAHDVD